MTADIRDANSELTAARELRAMMQGRVVLRGDGDYTRTRQIWNRAVEKQPALLAVGETSADVQAAVRVARRYDLPLSVRGGGHDWAGRALCANGLVIDLTRMREVVVDMHSRVATVAGGTKENGNAAAILPGPISIPASRFSRQTDRPQACSAHSFPQDFRQG
jgi:FAD/FMN-containing dehydrogenase